MQAFVIMTDEGELIGIAANEEIAIHKMIEHITWHKEHNHWFETEEEFEEATADIKLNLQAEGFISAEPTEFWSE